MCVAYIVNVFLSVLCIFCNVMYCKHYWFQGLPCSLSNIESITRQTWEKISVAGILFQIFLYFPFSWYVPYKPAYEPPCPIWIDWKIQEYSKRSIRGYGVNKYAFSSDSFSVSLIKYFIIRWTSTNKYLTKFKRLFLLRPWIMDHDWKVIWTKILF